MKKLPTGCYPEIRGKIATEQNINNLRASIYDKRNKKFKDFIRTIPT